RLREVVAGLGDAARAALGGDLRGAMRSSIIRGKWEALPRRGTNQASGGGVGTGTAVPTGSAEQRGRRRWSAVTKRVGRKRSPAPSNHRAERVRSDAPSTSRASHRPPKTG